MFGLEKIAAKFIIGGVISLAIAGTIYFMKMEIDTLKAEKATLVVEKLMLEKVNASNLKTIQALEKNDQLTDKLVNDLRIQIGRDKGNINNLREMIDKLKAEDNGPTAKVLKDTVTGVQVMRDTRVPKGKEK